MANVHGKSLQNSHPEVEGVLITHQQISRRVEAMAAEIAEHYRGMELTVVAVLTGSLVFLADLIRRLPLKMRISTISASSYPGKSTDSQTLELSLPAELDLAGRNVLLLDDILDSGRTIGAVMSELAGHGPASLRSCVLLRKIRPDISGRIKPDYVGFDVPHEFVVGYGLDYDNFYRNLPDICVLRNLSPATERRAL